MGSIKEFIKNEKRIIAVIISVVIAYLLFWSHFPTFSFDSCWYISYLKYFLGLADRSEWNAVRGCGLPLLLFLGHRIRIGYIGIQIVLSVIYLAYCIYVFKIYLLLVKTDIFLKSVAEILIIDCLLLFNPIIWGYAHLVLTEGVAVFIFVFFTYYTILYLKKTIVEKSSNAICYHIIAGGCFVFSWFLKQSFAIFIIALYVLTQLFVIIKKRQMRSILPIGAVFLVWFISLILWSFTISPKPIHTNSADAVQENKETSVDIINPGNMAFTIKFRYFDALVENNKILVNVLDDNGNTTTTFNVELSGNTIKDIINYSVNCLVHAPSRFIKGCLTSYGVMSDIYMVSFDGIHQIEYIYAIGPVQKVDLIDLWTSKIYSVTSENWFLTEYHLIEPRNYYEEIESRKEELVGRGIDVSLLDPYGYIAEDNIFLRAISWTPFWVLNCFFFSLTLLLIPIALVISIVLIIKNKSFTSIFTSILMFSALVFLYAHIFVGLPLDRYAVPVYVIMLLYILCIIFRSANALFVALKNVLSAIFKNSSGRE